LVVVKYIALFEFNLL